MSSDLERTGETGRVPIRGRLLFLNSAGAMVSHGLNVALLIWLQQYLLRRITPEEYALYPVVMAPLLLVPALTGVLSASIGRFVVHAWDRGDVDGTRRVVSTTVPVVAVLSLVLGSFLLALAWNPVVLLGVSPEHASDARLMLSLLSFGAVAQVLLAPFAVGLFVRQRFIQLNVLVLSGHVLRIVLVLALLLGMSPRVRWVVVANVVADLSVLLAMVRVSRRIVPELSFRAADVRWDLLREVLSFGSWTFLQGMAIAVRRGATPVLLKQLATPIDVACFHLGSLVFEQIQLFTMQATQPAQPALVAMHSRGDTSGLRSAYLRAGRYALWFAGAIAVPVVVYRRELVLLYVGEEFLAASRVVLLLLPILFVVYGNLFFQRIAQASGHVGPLSRTVVFNQSLALLLTAVLVWSGWGAVGAASGVLAASLASHLFLFIPMGLRASGVRLTEWLRSTIAPGLVPGLAGATTWWMLREAVRPASWTALACCAAGGGAVHAAALVAFCLEPPERRWLREGLRRVRQTLLGRRGNAADGEGGR